MTSAGPPAAAPRTATQLARRPTTRRVALVLLATTAVLAGAAWWAEACGWPFLAQPAARWLAQRLGRTVSLAAPEDGAGGFHLTLLGSPKLTLAHATLGNADWAKPGPMLDIHDLQLQWRWADLWQAYTAPAEPAASSQQAQALRIRSLVVGSLALQLQRGSDGRANWQNIGTTTATAPASPTPAVRFDHLQLGRSTAQLTDALQQLDLLAELQVQPRDTAATPNAAALLDGGLQLSATGHYRKLPVSAKLRTSAAQSTSASQSTSDAQPFSAASPTSAPDSAAARMAPIQLQLQASVGRAKLDFNGQVLDALGSQGLQGRYSVSGPSLAAVGEPLHLTLPATRAFAMTGRLVRQGTRWSTVVDKATVGSSRLAGEFTFDHPPGGVPLLAGRLRGAALLLQDLGPAVGLPTEPGEADPRRAGRLLPDRRFDLPSLRAMNANILVNLDRLDPGTNVLQPVAPLQAHLLLQAGVLDLQDIDAHLAQGRIRGNIQLDGRQPLARWQAQLTGTGLDLAQWVTPLKRPGGPPWASGRLGGRLDVQGHGRSSAELLASANGRLLLHLADGSVSHLAVEAAGLDLAQGLGLLLRGDDNLPVTCGAGDLLIKNGVVTPQVLMVDTRDSTLWLAGSVSLATEQLALTANVAPKDWSPLALRSPLHLDGTLAKPVLSLDKPALLQRLVPAALLALVNPLAALLPLIDLGGPDGGVAAITACRDAAARQQRQPQRGRAAKP